jgi:hypothetical protein
MTMEIFTIDGIIALHYRKNKLLLTFLEIKGQSIIQEQGGISRSALRFRKKSITTIVYLNIRKRKRMLELVNKNNLKSRI